MRILSSITVLLLASPSVALLSSHHEILRQLVEDRGLEVSEECLNATDILREDEDLAVATAAISAQVEEALFSGCQANGSNLNCASDIEASVSSSSLDDFKAACTAAGGFYNTSSFSFGCSGTYEGESIKFQFSVSNDFGCFSSVCSSDEIAEATEAAFEQGIVAVESQFPGLQCSAGESAAVSLDRAAMAWVSVAASVIMALML